MGEKRDLGAKLNKHFAALGAATAAITGVGIAQQSEAAIVYSGVVNIDISASIDGVYLNVATATPGATGATTPGWDINPYRSSSIGPVMSFFTSGANPTATNRGSVAATATGAALNLALGTPIGPGSVYNTGIASGTPNYPDPVSGIYGFRFFNEGQAAVRYGWAKIERPGTNGFGRIVDYAWEDTGGDIPAGIVPEPASLGLLALGAMGLVARRR